MMGCLDTTTTTNQTPHPNPHLLLTLGELLPTLDELQTAGSYIGLRLIGSNKEMASYVCEVRHNTLLGF
jgi:hypothetical protein